MKKEIKIKINPPKTGFFDWQFSATIRMARMAISIHDDNPK